MNKEVKYNGFSVQPSDYECQDGDLVLSLDLINRGNGIVAIPTPKVIFTPPIGMRVIYIHSLSDERSHYIMQDQSSGTLAYADQDNNDFIDYITIPDGLGRVLDISSVGNTLIVAFEAYLSYFLWRDNSYVFLGNKPDFVAIEFGLKCRGANTMEYDLKINISAEDYGRVSNSLPGYRGGTGASRPHQSANETASSTDYFFEALTNAVFGRLYSAYEDIICANGLRFYQPFMIRYAFRLYDGSYCWHSSPVLMLPTSVFPLLRAIEPSYADETYSAKIGFNDLKFFSLVYRILDARNLENWKDIIQSIDIFISSPLYTYDQSGKVSGSSSVNFCTTEGGGRGREEADRTIKALRLNGIFSNSDVVGQNSYHYDIAPYGHSGSDYWMFPSREIELSDDIRSCHQFYRVARIDFDDIKAMSELSPITFEDGVTADTLVTRPTLPDEFQSHHTLKPKILHSYNSRLNIADINLSLFGGLPLRSMMAYCNPTGHASDSTYHAAIRVKYRKSGEEYIASLNSNDAVLDELDAMAVDSFIKYPPRYLYIPDSDAVEIEVCLMPKDGGNPIFVYFPLKPHDFLNGSYYFGGFELSIDGDSPLETFTSSKYPDSDNTEVIRQNRIYVSDVNNPFVFNPQSVVSVGASRVTGLSTAAKALSQGQFGQFPLYAFTDEGIWSLEVSPTGVYSARQPITRDVCLNTSGITQLDSSVLFPTARGIMMLSGSECRCISDAINSETLFDITQLPHMDEILQAINHQTPYSFVPLLPFLQFINNCSMTYDYTNQQVIIFNPDVEYSYVLSLKSGLWGIIRSNFSHNLNSYPDAIVSCRNNSLVNFSVKHKEYSVGLLVTRPLKLDISDVLKTVDTIIQRGYFCKGHVQSVLYGSRDLINWHLVWSSKDHFLRGFRGSPYKYFRIVAICNLDEGEFLTGASVNFNMRYVDKLR